MRNLPITKGQFRAWLAAQDPIALAGLRNEPRACPIASACTESGHAIVSGVLTDLWISTDDRAYTLPDWAQAFIRAFDAAAGIPTVGQALTILDAVQE